MVAELKIVEWLELVSLASDNGDPLECWPCMGDTELVNGDSGSSDTSAAVRSSVESGRRTSEHSPFDYLRNSCARYWSVLGPEVPVKVVVTLGVARQPFHIFQKNGWFTGYFSL